MKNSHSTPQNSAEQVAVKRPKGRQKLPDVTELSEEGQKNLLQRLMAKTEKTQGCWNWIGYCNPLGYGRIGAGSRKTGDEALHYTHRAAYALLVGPIPTGLVIDHKCRNPRCLNPDHLEAVVQRINVYRGVGYIADCHRATNCVNGHPFDEENTRVTRQGFRQCRECSRIRQRAYYAVRRRQEVDGQWTQTR